MKMKTGAVLVTLVLMITCMLAGCSGTAPASVEGDDGFSGKVFISGAFALYPMMITWSEEYQKIHPNVQFEISAGGAGKGMTDALSDMVDIGMVSRDIYPEEQEKGAVWVAVTKDAVVGTVSSQNPYLEEIKSQGITKDDLEGVYVAGSITTWSDLLGTEDGSKDINRYTRSDACGAATIWAKYIGYNQEDLGGVGVYGDPGLAEAVRADPLGMGYNNINYAYDSATGKPVEGLFVITLDQNGNGKIDADEDFYSTRSEIVSAIADTRYPSPPSRELNLVTKDEFTGVTKEFVRWILTDGQEYVSGAGYIPLSQDIIDSELEKLD